jgi:hypothetical protein
MKIKYLRAGVLSMAAGALLSGCVVGPDGRVGFQPIIVAEPRPVYVQPAPVVEVASPEVVMVPDTYVWDGYENVGIVDGQYFYLGVGNVWLVADPFRLDRFHGWERGHPDWQEHAIRNDRFRRDAHGREQPMHDNRKAAPVKKDEKNKDEH